MHHHGKSIREVMTADPRTVEPSATLQEAARLMKSEDVGSLPVVEGDRLVAMVTDRDIAIRGVAEGKDGSATVGDIASRDLVTIDPQQSLEEAMRIMGDHQVRRLPVCEEDGRLVGIVAQADVALDAPDRAAGETLEEISK
jgi:CBS domain-containing protein